jgi:hypothetical protein
MFASIQVLGTVHGTVPIVMCEDSSGSGAGKERVTSRQTVMAVRNVPPAANEVWGQLGASGGRTDPWSIAKRWMMSQWVWPVASAS